MKRIIIAALIFVFGWYWWNKNAVKNVEYRISNFETILKVTIEPTIIQKKTITGVPFTVQAPLGEWKNPVFQNACEEASILMVYCLQLNAQCLVKDGVIDKTWAKAEIQKMSDWEVKNYGSNTDTSAEDTALRLLEKYFNIQGYSVKELENSEEIFQEFNSGGVWIIPMNGQKLGNPYFTAPGPERHMVVVYGYDKKTDEFITNDGGTGKGKGYRYNREIFWNAIRDYPTGDHQPITAVKKDGILIELP